MPNAITLIKIAQWLYKKRCPLFPKIIQGMIFIFYNCHLSYKCDIGIGTKFLHKGMASLILDGVTIGINCRLGMNIMITGKSPYKEVPKIGNNVWISPGVIISGPVIIEDNVIIAPNSYVNKSIPGDSIVGGNPARIIGNIKNLDYNIFENPSYLDGFESYLE